MNIGDVLVRYREQSKLSQEALADKIFVSRQTISNWETGKTYPDIQSLLLLASLYQVTVDDLVKGDVGLMKKRVAQTKTKWLLVGIGLLLILTYGSLISMRWLPPVVSALLIGTFTTLGLVLIGYFITFTKRMQLRTMRQILAYLNDKPVEYGSRVAGQMHWWQMVGVAFIGLLIGGALTWLIGVSLLGWHF